ncbi:MAG: hypothetical protein K2X81_24925, partial [Candidatus Obscuribacterales bacterium]|nr:hypothetical protein [Candidatus Obscuribacterales bacterium]
MVDDVKEIDRPSLAFARARLGVERAAHKLQNESATQRTELSGGDNQFIHSDSPRFTVIQGKDGIQCSGANPKNANDNIKDYGFPALLPDMRD